MSAPRAGDWHLLGHDSDPVPASPAEVSGEGEHYTTVASTIADQITRLEALAANDAALKGHYAEKLTESCDDLADHLGKIEGRFRSTGGALDDWSDDLVQAQIDTAQALRDAEEAKRAMDANAPDPVTPGAPEPTQAEKDATEAQSGRYSAAEGRLETARTDFSRAMSTLDGRAESVASTIQKASDDDMKDSRWDKFKDAVGNIADVLDSIADVLSWIGAALTIVALFIPGLNLLVIAAILLAGALLIHGLLAVTGNGSWTDVLMDAIGLATLGMGTRAMALARLGRSATLTRAGATAGRNAAARSLSQASFNGGRGIIGGTHKFLLQTYSGSTRAAMRTASDDAARAFTQRALPSTTRMEALRVGADHSLAALAKDHRLLVQELGEAAINPAFSRNLSQAINFTIANQATNIPLVLNPKIGPHEAWNTPGWSHLQDATTFTPGGPF